MMVIYRCFVIYILTKEFHTEANSNIITNMSCNILNLEKKESHQNSNDL